MHSKHVTEVTDGNRHRLGRRIEPADELYGLGLAQPDRTRGDSPVITHEKQFPFIIANTGEHEVMVKNASLGVFLMSIGISLLYLVLLWLGGSGGTITSMDFVALASVGPLVLGLQAVILLYNDLVFLQQRCERDRANSQISLKKQSNLVPRLQAIVKAMTKHEKTLLKNPSQLRRELSTIEEPARLDGYMKLEHDVIGSLRVLLEAYPEMSSDQQALDFAQRLIRLENEIAMIRAGYNDAVYSTTAVLSFSPTICGRFSVASGTNRCSPTHTLPIN